MNNLDFINTFQLGDSSYSYYDIQKLPSHAIGNTSRLPYSIRILVENLLRKLDNHVVTEDDLTAITTWKTSYDSPVEIPYHPARVLMQDFTGVPAVVDLAAMRDAVKDLGGDPSQVNPNVIVELVADHSVQVDHYGTENSLSINVQKEYERNNERYSLLKWAQKSFTNFQVVPPNSGICHQVNLEHLGRVSLVEERNNQTIVFPDTLVGLDSHTPMINGIGVMGWGVGGIEAEAVMLGQPYYMSIPEVVGVHLVGKPKPGITATDVVLTLTELLRKQNVVEKFVEYFGPGMQNLSIPDRATISNMTPEYGATLGFFPIDKKTIDYLKLTGRNSQASLTSLYAKHSGLWYKPESVQQIEYSNVIEFDLSEVIPSLAGPARPQDRIPMAKMVEAFADILGCKYERDTNSDDLSTFIDESGCETCRDESCHIVAKRDIDIRINNSPVKIGDGSVVIAAITSCTNTSNPSVLIGAGLMAKKAVKRGLRVPRYVKTSFTPGSKVVSRYLEKSGLMVYLEALGFHITAFGCTTCIGNSGPLNPELEQAIREHELNVAAVLSGNRNFEARIHQQIKSNFLASPMLVLAFALAGRIDIDLTKDPIGEDPNGQRVYLSDLWPTNEEIGNLVDQFVTQDGFSIDYGQIFDGDEFWKKLDVQESTTYQWNTKSTYIKKPPYFDQFEQIPPPITDITNARVFLLLGDTVTTDHISPAGAIPADYPAGEYLLNQGVQQQDFNSYGSRRGNHEIMMRGTFANIRIKNMMVDPKEGGLTLKYPEEEELFNYEASQQYLDEQTPLIVIGGKEYGTGSSRDWAAKGTNLLGVKAVIAESFERIHRNNLVGMGVLPLVFQVGENSKSLGLDGSEMFSISDLDKITPRKELEVRVTRSDKTTQRFTVIARLDTEVDVSYYRNGGILPYVLRQILT